MTFIPKFRVYRRPDKIWCWRWGSMFCLAVSWEQAMGMALERRESLHLAMLGHQTAMLDTLKADT